MFLLKRDSFYFWTRKPKTFILLILFFQLRRKLLRYLQYNNNNGFCFFCCFFFFLSTILNSVMWSDGLEVQRKQIFTNYFEVNIIENIINLLPIMLFRLLFRLSSCICLQAKFPWEILMKTFFSSFFWGQIAMHTRLKNLYSGQRCKPWFIVLLKWLKVALTFLP